MKSFNFFVPLQKQPSFNNGYQYLDGIASTVDVDRDVERMSKKALDKIAQTINSGKINLFMDHEHNATNAIGLLERAQLGQDNKSVQVKIRLEKTDSPMSPVPYLLDKLASGVNLGLSVGGRVISQHDEFDKTAGTKVGVIDDVELFEVSVVGIPSNPYADLSIAGSMAKSFKIPIFEKTLGDLWTAENGVLRKDSVSADSSVLTGQSAQHGHNRTFMEICPECKVAKGELLGINPDGSQRYKCRACGSEFVKDVMRNQTEAETEFNPVRDSGRGPGAPSKVLGKNVTFTREELASINKSVKDAQTELEKAEAENNPFAICNAALGSNADPDKLESCIQQVKAKVGKSSGGIKMKDAEAEAEDMDEAEGESESEATAGRPLKKPKKYVKEGEEVPKKSDEEEEEETEKESDDESESEEESEAEGTKIPEKKEADDLQGDHQSPEQAAERQTNATGATMSPGDYTPSPGQNVAFQSNSPARDRGLGSIQNVPMQVPMKSAKVKMEKQILPKVDLEKMVNELVDKKVKEILKESPSFVKSLMDNVGPETIEPQIASDALAKNMRFRP